MCSWVSRLGVPATITSDRGAQFTSALWLGLCSLLNIQLSPTTAYHPQSNGFHRWLKDTLRSRAAAADWHDHLPWVMLGIRAPFREDSKSTKGVAAGPLRSGPPERRAAAAVPSLRQTLPSAGTVNKFLYLEDRR
jgi:transposase InsO family protein